MGPKSSDAAMSDSSWTLLGEAGLIQDDAIRAGVEELQEALTTLGIRRAPDAEGAAAVKVAVSLQATRSQATDESRLIEQSSYEIARGEGSFDLLSSTPLGLSYALYELADQVRILGALPKHSTVKRPELPYRILTPRSPLPNTPEGPEVTEDQLKATREKFVETVHEALKFGYNILVVHNTQNHIPWGVEPYQQRSERYNRHLAEMVKVAHDHHIKFMLIGDEFTYPPQLLEQMDAKASVKDEGLWEVLKSKYRRLLESCPDLDGVGTRIGEHIPYFGLETLDLIHSEETEPDPRIEERYRRFIKTMQDVVVGEFGKLFVHRTWTVNVHEQHSVPQVYQGTFTPDVPVDNTLIAIKLTSGDQWYHCEPFNMTFGLTPHTTVAQGELFSGYQGGGSYVDYPARYFQAALEWAADRGTKGIMNGISTTSLPAEAMTYLFSRLGWDPSASADELTRRWAAKTFGDAASGEIADIFLLGAVAVRDGLYLRQPGLHNWEPIRHLRTNDFVVKGNPEWDNGRTHAEFLKGIYLECKPWIEETFAELDRGVATSRRMLQIFEDCEARIERRADELKRLLLHGLATMKLNSAYVKGFLTYFSYREKRSTEMKERLAERLRELDSAVDQYRRNFQHYNLQGILAFRDLGRRALDDLVQAEKMLADSLTLDGIQAMFDESREYYVRRLRENPDAIPIARWKGTMDGRDLIKIKGDSFTIEHISDDQISAPEMTVYNSIPRDRRCEVVIRPIEVRGTVYVKEQPTAENDYTVTLYTEDRTPGKSVFEFEMLAICE